MTILDVVLMMRLLDTGKYPGFTFQNVYEPTPGQYSMQVLCESGDVFKVSDVGELGTIMRAYRVGRKVGENSVDTTAQPQETR